ncbi:MAG TPA: N-acetylmuramoyl-L-alanine amidase [Gaiellaceae bacterium]|nr:N-acetylmuramoyl-L-alanine amidase [Gaiellaceae bacterium]
MRLARVALFLLLAFPAASRAGDVAMVVRDVPLGPRALQAVEAPIRFDMVGLHWQGPGTVRFRTHRLAGGWSPWTLADADALPDARSPERARTASWHDGAPVWTGASDRVQLRTRGTVTRLRAYYLWSRTVKTPVRRVAMTGQPTILPRFDWQANERIVRAKPLYAPTLRLAIVHHTVNANSYSRAQAAAIVRGIETYHVLGNGWNDIGYNFLVDRYGQIWEGRAGGIDRNVIGAHSAGFNTGSVGIALIGTYGSVGPTPAQRAALVRLLAWRLDVAHVDPMSFVPFTSLGNAKWPRGTPVTLRAISGHRDTYFTECPGKRLYDQIPAIAKAAAQTGLPKIYAPLAQAVPAEAVRFTATLSAPAAWTVSVTDRNGAPVASGKGTGAKVDWTWSGVTTAPAPYGWTIQAAGARPATGSLGGALPPVALVSGLAVPAVLAPTADGAGATVPVTFTLADAAQVGVQLLDHANRVVLSAPAAPLEPGKQEVDLAAGVLPDGRYRVVVSAQPSGASAVKASASLVVDRTAAGFVSTSPALSPNGDGALDTVTFSFTLNASVPLRLELQKDGVTVATLLDAQLGPGQQVVDWNGKDATGAAVPDGAYQAVLTVTDALGVVAQSLPLTVDTTPPQLTLLDASRLRFSLTEPATVTLLVNGARVVKTEPAGTWAVPLPKAAVQTVSAEASDAAGNVSPAVSSP